MREGLLSRVYCEEGLWRCEWAAVELCVCVCVYGAVAGVANCGRGGCYCGGFCRCGVLWWCVQEGPLEV